MSTASFDCSNYYYILHSLLLVTYYIELWRNNEKKKITSLLIKLISNGYVKVKINNNSNSVVDYIFDSLFTGNSNNDKVKVWDTIIEPVITQLWQDKGFDIANSDTWYPHSNSNGRAKEYTLTKPLYSLYKDCSNNSISITNSDYIRVCSDNYMIQSIIVSLCSDTIRNSNYHFGNSTHYKLRLLINPLWLAASIVADAITYLFDFNINSKMSGNLLYGVDEAWHIPVFPNTLGYNSGTMTPGGAHIDSGPNGRLMSLPIPINSNNAQYEDMYNNSIMQVAALQTAIVFYCDTPGLLSTDEGSTGQQQSLLQLFVSCSSIVTANIVVVGLFPYSHIIILEALRQACSNNNKNHNSAYNNNTSIEFGKVIELLKSWKQQATTSKDSNTNTTDHNFTNASGVDGPIVQESVSSDECVVVLGCLAHSTMFATKPMTINNNRNSRVNSNNSSAVRCLPRIIQNCKIHADPYYFNDDNSNSNQLMESFVKSIPKTSLLYKLHCQPLETWKLYNNSTNSNNKVLSRNIVGDNLSFIASKISLFSNSISDLIRDHSS